MEKSGTYYNQISTGYEELHREEQLKKLAIVKQNLEGKINPDTTLLDVGCGTGITSDFPCKVTGLDPAQKLLDKCKLPIIKVKGVAEDLPFDDDSFDIVVSITAIQNFEDIEKGLKEIKRVGKGIFALSFLKKSPKRDEINDLIKSIFSVEKVIEEEKDLIYFCSK